LKMQFMIATYAHASTIENLSFATIAIASKF